MSAWPVVVLFADEPVDIDQIGSALRREFPQIDIRLLGQKATLTSSLNQAELDAAIVDNRGAWQDNMALLEAIKDQRPDLPVVMVVEMDDEDRAIEALRRGLDNYVVRSSRYFRRLPIELYGALDKTAQRVQLAVTEARYRRLFEDAPIGLFRCTPDGTLTAVNAAFAAIFGLDAPSDLLNTNIVDLHASPEQRRDWLDRLQSSTYIQKWELEMSRRDGNTVWVRQNVRAVHGAGGEILYYEGSLEDIGEQRRNQLELQRSNAMLRLLFDNAFDGVSIHEEVPETNGRRLVDCNQRYAELAGHSKEELLAIQNTSQLQTKVSPAHTKQENVFLRRNQIQYRGLFSWNRPDGKPNVIEYSAAPVELDGRALTVGIDRDITHQIRSQEELQRRARHLEALNAVIAAGAGAADKTTLLQAVQEQLAFAFPGVTCGVWLEESRLLSDLAPEIIDFWQQCWRTDHQPPQTVIVDDWSRLSPEDDWPAAQQAMELHRQHGIHALLAVPIHSGDGLVAGLMAAAPQQRTWTGPEIALAQGIARESGAALERLLLTQRVESQALQMQEILDAAPLGILLLNREQRLILANPTAREYLASLTDQAVADGQMISRLGDRAMAELLGSGTAHALDINTVSGGARVFQAILQPLHAESIGPRWVMILRDITQERTMQTKAEQQARLAGVGQLVAGIAHDFNNILAVILLLLKVVQREKALTEKGRDRLGIIEQQAQHAADLIRQIMDFSRQSVIKRSVTNLGELLAETTTLLRRTLPESIEIELHQDNGPFILHGDSSRLQQAVMNLAVNARDAMPEGGRLAFHLARFTVDDRAAPPIPGMAPGPWLQFSATDTGTGIPEDVLPHIFEPFFSTKEVGGGTGLGLAQVIGIVKQHGGEIQVESRPGYGTTFTICLPALKEARPALASLAPPSLNSRPSSWRQGDQSPSAPPPSLPAANVLVVEDDDSLRETVAGLLTMHGLTVLTAANGNDALQLFRTHPQVDLVLSDIVMPGMDGLALYRTLRQEAETPMILMSGYPADGENREWLRQSEVEWLLKPIQADQLLDTIRRVLARK